MFVDCWAPAQLFDFDHAGDPTIGFWDTLDFLRGGRLFICEELRASDQTGDWCRIFAGCDKH